ncbi:helix-turn-helix transcriptional regulator [Paenibacillus sp. 3LSP]|uniref:helix-turn-helix domain-containing protein n=1 Tax=Paenibacillus sp. 3LSP TaxID=2800795 RepID=UPI0028FD6E33|nr:helix-turn-helix transcriptional regulator [Paenibacillus sp. 3LSP]MDU0332570.1 helix-turn-helix transcriptional regulator [Paenibacillus sp. 3LSP]
MLAQRLLYLRQQKKKTQAEMANLLGITRQAYGYYEKGEREPDTESLNKLADFFDVSVDYLLGRTDKPRALERVNDFDEKEQAEFEAFINNPEYGLFFRDYLSAPEERRREMWEIWRVLRESEKGRKPGQRQGE